MSHFLKEPLLHFALLGAAIFMLYNLTGERDANTLQPDSIIVTAGKIDTLSALFQRTWQRPPSQQELDGLIQDYVREEVLYREGIAMGLDQDDTVIRRRIRQKMDFIVEDMTAQTDPGDEELQQYLQQHAEQFRIAPQFSFRQVYLNPDNYGAMIGQEAERLLAALRQGTAGSDPASLGDRIMLEPAYQALPSHQIDRLFGENFATALDALPVGGWQGPVKSGYGLHLVSVDARTDGRLPELAEVRASVLREWDNARRIEARETFYQSLLDRYSIVIESAQATADIALREAETDR